MKYWLFLIVIILCLSSFGLADDVLNFSTYMNIVKVSSDKITKIPKISLLKEMISIKNEKCKYTRQWNNYILSPVCLINKQLPNFEYKDVIDNIWADIDWFETIYNDLNKNFVYESTDIYFEWYKSFMPWDDIQKYILINLQKKWKKISIPIKYIYYEKSRELWIFVVGKDLSMLKNCTKQNYNVAINSLDNFLLYPWESLNINKHIAYLPWYCKWSWPQDLMFFGGVCGFASQLFRIALIHPDIEVVKRYWHSVWLTAYYGDDVYGDDAAIYENSKQFEIKNNFKDEVYFKVFDRWNYKYLLAITPTKSVKWVNINKTQISNLSAKLEKQIYDKKSWKILDNITFDSKYSSKSSAIR